MSVVMVPLICECGEKFGSDEYEHHHEHIKTCQPYKDYMNEIAEYLRKYPGAVTSVATARMVDQLRMTKSQRLITLPCRLSLSTIHT